MVLFALVVVVVFVVVVVVVVVSSVESEALEALPLLSVVVILATGDRKVVVVVVVATVEDCVGEVTVRGSTGPAACTRDATRLTNEPTLVRCRRLGLTDVALLESLPPPSKLLSPHSATISFSFLLTVFLVRRNDIKARLRLLSCCPFKRLLGLANLRNKGTHKDYIIPPPVNIVQTFYLSYLLSFECHYVE